MEAARLYEQFLAIREPQRGVFPGGEIVRVGPSSIAIIPADHPDSIVKIIKPGHTPRGLSVAEEFETLQRLQKLDGELFVTPTPLSFGHTPDFLHMERLGNSFGFGAVPDSAVERIGRAVGDFSGLLFQKHGAIHTDICNGNYTDEPNGKIGIIDIASVEKSDIPEKLFLTPLLYKPNISPYIADEFERRTGISIDFGLVQTLMAETLPTLLRSHRQPIADDIQNKVTSNLQEWADMRSAFEACHRPTKRPEHPSARKVLAS